MNRTLMTACLVLQVVLKPGLMGEADEPNRQSGDAAAMRGLWTGSWGGGMTDDGVIYQPVIAEFFVGRDDQAVWRGLPIPDGEGKLSLLGGDQRRGQLLYAKGDSGKSPHEPKEFLYRIHGDKLTLKIGGKRNDLLLVRKASVNPIPFANLEVRIEVASEVDRDGNLATTEYRSLRIGDDGPELPAPFSQKRPLHEARIYRVTDEKLDRMTIADLRTTIAKPTPVVVISRGERKKRASNSGLVQRHGAVPPDSQAAVSTLGYLLKPGSIVIVVPESQLRLVPKP